jgi:hypothetical protein
VRCRQAATRGLGQREASVARRHARVQEHLEPGRLQALGGEPRQQPALEAPARQGHRPEPAPLADALAGLGDRLRQRRVHAGTDHGGLRPPLEVLHDRAHQDARVQLHRRLAFVRRQVADTQQARHRIEEPARARRRHHTHALAHHRLHRRLRRMAHAPGAEPGRDQVRQRHAPGLAHRGIAAGQGDRADAGHPLDARQVRDQDLPTPDGAVRAEAGAVPGHSDHRSAAAVVGQAGGDVGMVVLDRFRRRGPHSGHALGGAWKRREAGSSYSAAQAAHMVKADMVWPDGRRARRARSSSAARSPCSSGRDSGSAGPPARRARPGRRRRWRGRAPPALHGPADAEDAPGHASRPDGRVGHVRDRKAAPSSAG